MRTAIATFYVISLRKPAGRGAPDDAREGAGPGDGGAGAGALPVEAAAGSARKVFS